MGKIIIQKSLRKQYLSFSHCNTVIWLYSKEEYHTNLGSRTWQVNCTINTEPSVVWILSAQPVLLYWVQLSIFYNGFCPLTLHLIYCHVSYWKHLFKISAPNLSYGKWYAGWNFGFKWHLRKQRTQAKQTCSEFLFCSAVSRLAHSSFAIHSIKWMLEPASVALQKKKKTIKKRHRCYSTLYFSVSQVVKKYLSNHAFIAIASMKYIFPQSTPLWPTWNGEFLKFHKI